MRNRIAIVLPSLLPVGGVERLVLCHAEEFVAMGHAVDLVFLNQPGDVQGAIPVGCRAFNLGSPRLRYALPALVTYLRTERPHAIHAAVWPLTCAVAIARRLAGSDARLVLSDHNPLSIQYADRGWMHRVALRASLRITYGLADARVAVSSGVASDLAKLSRLDRSDFTVIHNPVWIKLKESSAEDQKGTDSIWENWRGKRVITVGRLKAQKNHALLIRAFKRLLQAVDARLMIVGVGELEDETRAWAIEAGIADKVLMPGHLADPEPLYRSADLFVLSSDYEGFGNVLVEALACGVPVVSTDCPGGPAEILMNGVYGRLVPMRDEEALAQAMLTTLAEPVDRDKLRSRARDFAPRRLAAQFEGLLLPATAR